MTTGEHLFALVIGTSSAVSTTRCEPLPRWQALTREPGEHQGVNQTGSRPQNYQSSYPYMPTSFNGSIYFTANDNTHGYEVWKTDGTDAGTVMLNDINPGVASGQEFSLRPVGGWLHFGANDGTHGDELWRTDGTAASTTMIKDIVAVAGSSYASPTPTPSPSPSQTGGPAPIVLGAPPRVPPLVKGKPVTVTLTPPPGASATYTWTLTPKKVGSSKPKAKVVGHSASLKTKKSWKGGKLTVTITVSEPDYLPYTTTLSARGTVK